MLSWTFRPQPQIGSQEYSGLVLTEFILRAPLDGTSGGEVAVVTTAGDARKAYRFALEPGVIDTMPDVLAQSLHAWLLNILKKKGIVPDEVIAAERPAAPTTKPEPPPGFAGTLG